MPVAELKPVSHALVHVLVHAPALAVSCAVLVAFAGCRSPLVSPDGDRLSAKLDQAINASSERELAGVAATPAPTVSSRETAVDRMLSARRTELDSIGPQSRELGKTVGGTVPLTAETPNRVVLTRQAAIEAAVRNNLDVQTARVEKAITVADVIRAEAAFDWVAGAGVGFERIEEPSVGILFPGGPPTPVIPNLTNQRNWSFDAGLNKALTSGGALNLTARTTRIDNVDTSLFVPDPAWSSAVVLGLTQPLLRGFGEDVALAQVRLAENNDKAAAELVRGRLLDLVAQTEQAYWALVSARARLVSAEWLVRVGEEVRDVLAKRREFDATLAQYANAVATVEQRKAIVIEARRRLSEAGNALKVLLNDPSLPVGGEADVVPADVPSDAPFEADLRKSIETAIARAPSIQQALIAIDSATIGATVADNGRLPQLDLATSVSWFGLQGDFGDSFSDITSGDFVDYAAGLRFSQAIGNRAAEETFRVARLRRSQTVIGYEKAVQGTVLAVKNALVDCVSFRELVEQNRTYRLAQAENLRALLVDEKTLAALTPEFLQLKFQLQNGLAAAEDAYFASLVGYQSAIAALQRAMGTGLEANRIEIESPAADEALEPVLDVPLRP
ncbi:MAG: TolC family protein [Limnohabitans sp.]|nr:TolC family protein [Limnohabitans sp.]